MEVIDLLEYLKNKDVKLAVSDGKLKYNAPEGAITVEIKERINRHKAEIISILKKGQPGCSFANQIILGDCLEELKKIPAESVDLLVTDPPYGMKFMGKAWDKALPQVDIWKQCLRVLKPGAFAFVMGTTIQNLLSRMVQCVEEAGFDSRFTSLYWAYAEGMPKGLNISRAVDKKARKNPKIICRNPNSRENCDKSNTLFESGTVGKTAYITEPTTEEAKSLNGAYAGFQPKPAVEAILVLMKPCSERGYTNQALSNKKGIAWLDQCRIPYSSDENLWNATGGIIWSPEREWNQDYDRSANVKGRFPANLLVSDEVLGRLSKFFSLDAWKDIIFPFICVPKASQKEKEAGLEKVDSEIVLGDDRKTISNTPFRVRPKARKNIHPTVKPLKLMSYLITMGSREGDLILDPFSGSGSTCIAAMMLNRNFIGMEIDPKYHQIARKRLEHYRRKMAAA